MERSKTVKGGNPLLPPTGPAGATPAISDAGSVKGGGDGKKKTRGNQGDLVERLNIVYDGPKEAAKVAAEGKPTVKGQFAIESVLPSLLLYARM